MFALANEAISNYNRHFLRSNKMRVVLTFGPGNRQALDAKVGAEPVNDKQGPLGIGDGNKDKVGNQVVVLAISAEDGL